MELPSGIQWIQSVVRSAPVCPGPAFYQTQTTAGDTMSVKRIWIILMDGMQSTWIVHYLSCLTPDGMFATTLMMLTVGQGPSIDFPCKNVFENDNKENSFDSKFHWYAWLESETLILNSYYKFANRNTSWLVDSTHCSMACEDPIMVIKIFPH